MENSKIKDRLKKENTNHILKFIKDHARYFVAGLLFFVLVLVLVNCADPRQRKDGEGAGGTELAEDMEEAYQVDAYENVNALITQYYTAYAAGDIAALTALATPISANEQSYITLFSQYVDEYQNIKCYTKSGLDASSYLVSVSMEIKFTGVDTTAPGLDFFYIRTNEQGTLYIDNLYSQYNLANQENALDTSVRSLIDRFENDADVIALKNEIQTRYDEAIAADENLKTMIKETIPGRIDEWIASLKTQNTQPENTEMVADATETVEEEPTEIQEETTEETTPTTETLATTDRVNVRAGADTSAEKLGTVEKGTIVTRTGVEGDWSIIDYNGTTGYIKNEYLTYDTTSASADPGTDDGEESSVVSFAEGTEIILQSAVNIRSGMSETADKVGTAYAGEKVTVVMSYAEGWTKVTWSGKTGYIKSSLLQ